MPGWLLLIIIVAIISLWHVIDSRKESADDRRTKKLVECAKRDFPHNALTESLGDLYGVRYNQIILANLEGRSIKQLTEDRELIAAEVCRIWREESDRKLAAVDSECHFKVIQNYRRKLSPRQTANAHIGHSD